MLLSELSRRRYLRWRTDPIAWVREELGVEPDRWQLEVLEAYASGDKKRIRIAMVACVGPGKTAVLAWISIHHMLFMGHHGSHPQGYALSKSRENLRDNLWKEIAKWHNKSRISSQVMKWTATRFFNRDHPETWFLAARSYAKAASSEEIAAALSGLHTQYPIIPLDEVGSMPVEVGNAADQALSTDDLIRGVIPAAGNPITRRGLLYDMAVLREEQHHVVHITGDPDDPNRSPRINIDWAREQIAKRGGRDHPWVMAHILGQFPPTEFNALLSEADVDRAVARSPHPASYETSPMVLGIDVAGEGADRSVIFPRQGWLAYPPVVMYSGDGILGAGEVSRLTRELDVDVTFLDGCGGYGLDWRTQMKTIGLQGRLVHGNERASDDRHYYNKRAEMWWRMADWVKEGGALPNVPGLKAELTVPTYNYKGDRMIMEDKDDVKKEIGRSPDLADALAFTFAEWIPPRKFARGAQQRHAQADVEDDPLRGY